MADQEYCLRWNNHQTTLTGIFDKLLRANRYTDCTISAGGQNVAAHKLLLTACSPYFDGLFSGIRDDRHAVIVLSDVTYAELRALMDYMYRGEVNISQDRLAGLLKVAEALQIRGLYEPGENQTRAPPPPAPAPPPVAPSNRTSGLTIERTRRSVPTLKTDFPLDASRDDASRSPVPKRRKRPTTASDDFAPTLDDLLTESGVAGLPPPLDKILPASAAPAPDLAPALPKLEPAFQPIQPKEEYLDDPETVLLDDDDDDDEDDDGHGMGNDELDNSQQPGTSHMGEGSSSQGYPPSWHDQSNDEVFMAAQQAVGDGTQREAPSTSDTELFYSQGKMVKRPFQCPTCPKRYTWQTSLHTHIRLECGKEAQFQCAHCSYRSKWKYSLARHFKASHSGTRSSKSQATSRPFECERCHKRYTTKKILYTHLKLECGVEPKFLCRHCPYRCKVQSNFARHGRAFHKKETNLKLLSD